MSKKTILLVDDEDSILVSVGWAMEKSNFEVTTASDGGKALELLRSNVFDLVITDLKMPGIGGLEVLQQVKEQYPRTSVFILTGFGDIQTAIQALQLGADDYLLKPCDIDELLQKAERSFERQKLLVQLQLQNEQLAREIESRKKAEDLLRKAHEGLEQLVALRTQELTQTVSDLNAAVAALTTREEELQEKNEELFEVNTTLNTLLTRKNREHRAIRAELADKTAKTVLPLLEKAKRQSSGSTRDCMETARVNLLDIFTDHSQESLLVAKMSPRELEVINYIKQKKTSKEIAELLNLSVRTIEFYRENIRKKLRIDKKKKSLNKLLTSTI